MSKKVFECNIMLRFLVETEVNMNNKVFTNTSFMPHDYALCHLYLAVVLSNKKEDSMNNKLFMKTCLKVILLSINNAFNTVILSNNYK